MEYVYEKGKSITFSLKIRYNYRNVSAAIQGPRLQEMLDYMMFFAFCCWLFDRSSISRLKEWLWFKVWFLKKEMDTPCQYPRIMENAMERNRHRFSFQRKKNQCCYSKHFVWHIFPKSNSDCSKMFYCSALFCVHEYYVWLEDMEENKRKTHFAVSTIQSLDFNCWGPA